jgi:predicted acyl esterase
MTGKKESSPESIIGEIKRQTCRRFTAEERIRIVLEGVSLVHFADNSNKDI